MTTRKIIVIILVTAFAVAGTCGILRVREWYLQTKSEYETVTVVRKITEFVDSHDGQWPRSWNDIPLDHDVRHLVHVDFDADVDRLINDPDSIYSTITPISGTYRTYPHAAHDLEELRDHLRRKRLPTKP